jgi:AbiU2
MSAEQRLAKAKRLTARINGEVIRAFALQAMWVRCANRSDVLHVLQEELGFPIVRDSLLIDLSMTLCRLHEHGREDSATIPIVISLFEDPDVRKRMTDQGSADAAIAKYAELQRSGVIRRIRVLRDRVPAHNDMRKTELTAAYGDETVLLEESAWIAERLHRAVAGSQPQFTLYRKTWKLAADSFWNRTVIDTDAVGGKA